MTQDLQSIIDLAWEGRANLNPANSPDVRKAVDEVLAALDGGQLRVAERKAVGDWTVHQWLKKAVLLSFRLTDSAPIPGAPGGGTWWDKVPSKFDGWMLPTLRPPASAPCPAPSCAARPSSPRTRC
jgi:2,3,4,5-tetrahydropyridine-2-carboxylate N-succinyltransferase